MLKLGRPSVSSPSLISGMRVASSELIKALDSRVRLFEQHLRECSPRQVHRLLAALVHFGATATRSASMEADRVGGPIDKMVTLGLLPHAFTASIAVGWEYSLVHRQTLRAVTAWNIITGEYPPQPGGVSDYTRLVAHGLADAGDEVCVYAPPADASRAIAASKPSRKSSPRSLRPPRPERTRASIGSRSDRTSAGRIRPSRIRNESDERPAVPDAAPPPPQQQHHSDVPRSRVSDKSPPIAAPQRSRSRQPRDGRDARTRRVEDIRRRAGLDREPSPIGRRPAARSCGCPFPARFRWSAIERRHSQRDRASPCPTADCSATSEPTARW